MWQANIERRLFIPSYLPTHSFNDIIILSVLLLALGMITFSSHVQMFRVDTATYNLWVPTHVYYIICIKVGRIITIIFLSIEYHLKLYLSVNLLNSGWMLNVLTNS